MSFIRAADGPLVLVGGTGVVGRNVACLLARCEGRPIVLAGRSAERAAPVLKAVQTLGVEARFERLVLGEPWPLLPAAAVLGLVNDPDDLLLRHAVEAQVPFVDVTRWTARMTASLARLAGMNIAAPVVLASGWMGGLLPRAAAALMHELGEPAMEIDGAIRYALADASGEDSVAYMDRLWVPFEVRQDGGARIVMPWSDARCRSVAGQMTRVRRLDTPEQLTLPLTLGAETVAVRMGFDSGLAGTVMAALVHSGVFRWLRGERFRGVRHRLLRARGAEQRTGARASFRVAVRGRSGRSAAASLVHQGGQAALTAVGAWLSLRWALTGAPGRVVFPEEDPANRALREALGHTEVSFHPEAA